MIDVAVLLSVGRHPVSGRARRAPADAQALELAFGLAARSLTAWHAGLAEEPALRDYLGMGLERLDVLALAPGHDPVAPLAAALDRHLGRSGPALVLAGRCAEGGEDSGMLPYLIAQALDYAIVADAVAVTIEADAEGRQHAHVVQALPRGQRRLVVVPLPAVVTVHAAAPAARPSAFARARRGVIAVTPVAAEPDGFLAACAARPWRPRPRLLRRGRGASALDRLKAATETASGKGQLLVGVAADAAAEAIEAYLVELGMLTQ